MRKPTQGYGSARLSGGGDHSNAELFRDPPHKLSSPGQLVDVVASGEIASDHQCGVAQTSAVAAASIPDRSGAPLQLEIPIATTMHSPSSPSFGWLVAEPLRAALEYARTHLMNRDHLPTGDGHPVVLYPGLGADQRYMYRLKNHCEQLGYVCYDWGRGFNTGPEGNVKDWVAGLATELQTRVSEHRQSVSLIGWSLGGIYAREIAKILKTRIRQVITLGSPFGGTADSTNAAWLYRVINGAEAPSDEGFAKSLKSPPPVPTTSIYSRTDGVVAWQSCRVMRGPCAENIEVDSSHLGLVCHPTVFNVVADRLAQPAGEWNAWRDTSSTHSGIKAETIPKRQIGSRM